MTVNVDQSKCSGCAICMDACPVDAITVDQVAKIDQEACINCGSCVVECPNGALVMEEEMIAASPVATVTARNAAPNLPRPPADRTVQQQPRSESLLGRIADLFAGSPGQGRGAGRGQGSGRGRGRGKGRGGRGRGRGNW
ncbi:MAG: indolepyruvate ferredoxin oxidoreductase subunit alpha [Alphaproteobacteria bacterium]